jgi:RNA polymerase sigma-70 factor, ECF subfamily
MHTRELQVLLSCSQNGDLEAFSRIVSYFQVPISRYLLHIVGDFALAEDLTQDTFLELYTSLSQVHVREEPGHHHSCAGAGGGNDGDGGGVGAGPVRELRGWLYRAATNNALSALRRRRRFSWLPISRLYGHEANTGRTEEEVVERDLVRAALTSLSHEQAECLLMHDSAGMKCAEIAEQQGISLDAAKQRLARARRGFIKAYKGSLQPDDDKDRNEHDGL